MEISHQPCPSPNCNSSDAYSYNQDTGYGYCHSCGYKKVPSREYVKQEEGISLEPYFREYRGISKELMEKHNCYFTKYNDKETVHWQYPNATKHRELPKSIKISGTMDMFFGQDDYSGGKVLTITEGEEDRMSVLQIMGGYPCVSVPSAAPSKAFWNNAVVYLQKFEKIVLSVDTDTAGDALAERFFRIFPGKVYRVDHGKFKDANDFLQAGDIAGYKASWWNAGKVKPDNINTTAEDFIKVYNDTPKYEYFKTDIEGLDEKMLGIHKSALTLILAESGLGKTELMRYLEIKCKDSGYSFGFCHGEETELRSLLGLVSYELADNLTRKDIIEAKDREADVLGCLDNFGRSEMMYQFSIRVDQGVDDIVEQVRFLVAAMGVDYIFLEPIQDFVSGNTTEKESLITDLANKLKRLAAEINVGIVIIAHANADGDAKYCKSLTQSAAYEIFLERDLDATDPQERNRMYVKVGRKNRTGGGSGPCGSLTFDVDTYMLTPDMGPVEPVTPKGQDDEIGF